LYTNQATRSSFSSTRVPLRRWEAIDAPPSKDQVGTVSSALRTADVAIVSMASTMGEYERLPEVWAAIDDVEPLRATPLVAAVLMNRTVTNVYRELMTEEGHTVLSTTIPRREPIAQALGGPVTDLGKYADAANEIETLEARR
jgi:chromosome partitioning protein